MCRLVARTILHLAPASTPAHHPEKRSLYDMLRLNRSVLKCEPMRRIYSDIAEIATAANTFNYKCQVPLVPPTGPLKVISFDFLGLLPRTTSQNQFSDITTDRYSNLNLFISALKYHRRKLFMYVLSDGLMFTSSVFFRYRNVRQQRIICQKLLHFFMSKYCRKTNHDYNTTKTDNSHKWNITIRWLYRDESCEWQTINKLRCNLCNR